MAGLLSKLGEFIGFGTDERIDEDFVEEDNADYIDEEALNVANHAKKRSYSNVVPMPDSNSAKVIVYYPGKFEDTQVVIDNLKSRKPVVVNMEGIHADVAQRIVDFLGGAIYALNGTLYKVSARIFIVAPSNCDVIGDRNDEGILEES